MDTCNLLSQNLKAYQKFMNLSLYEFSRELNIPKSTLATVLKEGNATLVTAIQLSKSTGISLDKLVFDRYMPEELFILKDIETAINWMAAFPPEKRNEIARLISEIWEVISK